VPKIIVGFRDKQGTLLRVEELATQSIPTSVKKRGRSWDGNTCVNFAAAFLDCEFFGPFRLGSVLRLQASSIEQLYVLGRLSASRT
jgi:hypothetical protein